jgi:dihydrofolate reductase
MTTARAAVYIATSVDGFIARLDGSLDWLPGADGEPVAGSEVYDGDYGYADFMASIDVLVMGRNTFDMVVGFGAWSYGATPVVVLTSRPVDIPADAAATVTTMSGSAVEIAETLGSQGHKRLYVDGANVIQQFLAAGLVDDLTITRVPVVLGEGIALFGANALDIELRHISTEGYPTGLTQSTYAIG